MRHLLSLSMLSFALIALSACSSTDEATGCTAASCGEGTVCDAATGQCVLDDSNDCIDDSECTDGQVCRNSECVSRCDGVQCSTGQTCDPSTGLCVDDGSSGGGGDGDCSADEDCLAAGVACINGACLAGPGADCSQFECQDGLNCATGLIGSQCLVPCTEASECGIFEQCLTDPPVFLAGFRDHCFTNTCGPHDQFPPGDIRTNILEDAQYLGPCPVSGDPNGGSCWGEFDLVATLGRGGICFGATGTKVHGESCSTVATHGDENACLNSFCAPQTNTCMDFCNLFDDALCPEGSACLVITDPPGHDRAGVCAPQSESPVAPLEACTPSPLGINPCVDGSFCAPRDMQEGTANVCLPACLMTPDADGTGACSTGTCTAVPPELFPERIGLCAQE